MSQTQGGAGFGLAGGLGDIHGHIYLIPDGPEEGVWIEAWEIERQGPPSSDPGEERDRGPGGGEGEGLAQVRGR